MLRAILFSVFVMLSTFSLFAQEFDGQWQGVLVLQEEDKNEQGQKYRADLQLNEVENTIEGTLELDLEEVIAGSLEDWSGTHRIEGKREVDQLFLLFFPMDRQTSGANCLATAVLDLDAKSGNIAGTSDGEPYAAMRCQRGDFQLKKLKVDHQKRDPLKRDTLVGEIKGRWISQGESVEVSKNFTIRIFDHLEIDGDIVSFYFNGKRIVRKHHLNDKPLEVELEMDTSVLVNHLVVLAHNTGKHYPNTVAVEVLTAGQKKLFILNSDKEHSDIIYFHLAQ